MKLLVFSLLAFVFSAQAYPRNRVLDLVDRDLKLLFMNTIEEGGVFATLVKKESFCRTGPGPKPGTLVHECELSFLRRSPDESPGVRCRVRCHIDFLESATGGLSRDELLSLTCLDELSESC